MKVIFNYKLMPVLMLILYFSSFTSTAKLNVYKNSDNDYNKDDYDFSDSIKGYIGVSDEAFELLKSSKQLKGTQVFSISVNNKGSGVYSIDFNEGVPCITEEILSKLNVNLKEIETNDVCIDIAKLSPLSKLEIIKYKSHINIYLPEKTLLTEDKYLRSGAGAFINYSAFYNYVNYGESSYDRVTVSSDLGFNVDNWMIRSRQYFSSNNNENNFDFVDLYAQRTFESFGTALQLGELNGYNFNAGSFAFTGVQFFNDSELSKTHFSGHVKGIANSQAKVEVWQGSVLIGANNVSAGPFEINDLVLVNSSQDLTIKILESSGNIIKYDVPIAQAIESGTFGAKGFSFALGQYRAENQRRDGDWFTSINYNFLLDDYAGVKIGGIFFSDRQVVSAGIRFDLGRIGSFDTNLKVSNTDIITGVVADNNFQTESKVGANLSSSWNKAFSEYLNLSFHVQKNTRNYREIYSQRTLSQTSSTPSFNKLINYLYSTSLSWNSIDDAYGSASISYSNNKLYDGETSDSIYASWNKKITLGHLSFSVNKTLNTRSLYNTDDVKYNLSWSLPLGGNQLRTYVNKAKNNTSIGSSFNSTVNNQLNYGVSLDRSEQTGESSFGVRINTTPYYTRLGLGVDYGSDQNFNYNASLNGGVVFHQKGITFSPQNIGDSFAIVNVHKEHDNEGIGLIAIKTPSGIAWSDYWGNAVVASLPSYKTSEVSILQTDLSGNQQVHGIKTFNLNVAKGSVVDSLGFGLSTVESYLVNIRTEDGKPLPSDSVIYQGDDFLGMSMSGGSVYFELIYESEYYDVVLPNGDMCKITLTNINREAEREYKTAEETCFESK